MKILLLGSNGQLGWELTRTCPDSVELSTCDVPKVDFLNSDSIFQCIDSRKPNCIINTAACTAVDEAETEAEHAFLINHKAVTQIAELCKNRKIALVHISTDYVFDGKACKPYLPDDKPDPRTVYGASKLKGEQAVFEILGPEALVIRTAWLYSAHGHNFVKTMVKLMQTLESLRVIDEQIGSPTWARGLATAIWQSISKKLTGTFHWTDAGVASWYDFAVAIQEESLKSGLIDKAIPIYPVSSSEYPTPAKRPNYSLLDKQSFWQALGHSPIHWRTQLRTMLKELDQ